MRTQLLKLCSAISFPEPSSPVDPNKLVRPKDVASFNTEVNGLGYAMDRRLISRLEQLSFSDFDAVRTANLLVLGEVTGASGQHRALFKKFPYETPEDAEYLERLVIGQLQNMFGYRPNSSRRLTCGHVVDDRLFPDLDNFGGCPICQNQVDELSDDEPARYPFQSTVPLKILTFADGAFLKRKADILVARGSSLSQDEKDLLTALRGTVNITIPDKIYRETLPIVYLMVDDASRIIPHLSGATDVLRIAAYLSDSKADLSLKEKVKFKVSTRHKKNLLRMLESLDNLEEDMLRHRERWLRLGEILNPGSGKNAARYPKVASAFDALRNSPKDIDTFGRFVENRVRSRIVDIAMLERLSRRPGEFIRRFDFLLRTTSDPDAVIDYLGKVSKSAPIRLLMGLNKYLSSRNELAGGKRAFLPKGSVNKMQLKDDDRLPIAGELITRAVLTLDRELRDRFSKLPPMGRVYIDPKLFGVVMPYNRRGDSSTNTNVVKGGRFPLKAANIVRLFVHWTGDVDVDLSAVFYDENFNTKGYVAFTRLRDGDVQAVHSGDITSAPNGASEFIDFNMKNVRKIGARYVAMTVISYRGDGFDSFPCFAGFMERDAISSGQKYEPESVRLKFDVKSKATGMIPLIIDVKDDSIIFADITSGNGRYGGHHRSSTDDKFRILAKAVCDMPKTKPTAFDVLAMHAFARGTIVNAQDEADVRYTIDDLDIDAIDKMLD